MRMILMLAAAGAALIAAAPAGSATLTVARGGKAQVARGSGGPLWRMHRDFRRDDFRRHDRDRRHRGGFDRGDDALFYPYGFDSYEWPDPHGNGFFAGGGGEVRLSGGRPYYDYDRSYPYEWSSPATPRPRRPEWAEERSPPPPLCRIEVKVRVCRSGR